jgi:hypothetical protein
VNESEWRQQVQKFRNLLRTPVGDDEQGVRQESRTQIETAGWELPGLVFDNDQEWFNRDDDWVIARLAPWVTTAQDNELLDLLRNDDGVRLITCVADKCVSEWKTNGKVQTAAPATEAAAPVVAAPLTGTENTSNWAGNRTPGTFYYAHNGTDYLYSDKAQAPAGEWLPLAQRQQAATDRAQAWGTGWCTPTDGDAHYGGAYVFAASRGGPWLLQAEAERALAATATPTPAAPAPTQWGSVWTNYEDGEWRFGLTEAGPWTYEDGTEAIGEQRIVDDVAAELLTRYPNADMEYVRTLTARYVAETSTDG